MPRDERPDRARARAAVGRTECLIEELARTARKPATPYFAGGGLRVFISICATACNSHATCLMCAAGPGPEGFVAVWAV